ncbi:MAG TPA: ATP-dependent endonuclease, partial [Acidimicrobiia bacterium]
VGFFVCVLDLEDEMIRSLGAGAVVEVIQAQREIGSFRIFQHQPAQRERTIEAQLRRFLGTHSGRKIAYGALLADALDLDRVPRPLEALLGYI